MAMVFDKRKNKSTGRAGEEIAARYLEAHGYKILDRNVELFCGEIDILAKVKNIIVIVEVKTVRGAGFGLAQELVRFKKQNKLRLLAKAIEQEYPDQSIRIDVIGVEFTSAGEKLEHLISAVEG